MPADPLEIRLSAARPAAAEPSAALIGALRHRRHSRRAAALGGVLAASLAISAAWWAISPRAMPQESRNVAAAPAEFIPTIRALSVANQMMDADNLWLPSVARTAAAEPITARSLSGLGG